MRLRNIPIFTSFNAQDMPGFIYKSRFIIAIAIAAILLLSSCSKSQLAALISNPSQTLLQQYFEDNILNHDFKVQLATDSTADLTNQFAGYTFKLTKNTYLNGPMTATNGTDTYTGTWSSNDDYSKLVITLPVTVISFNFLNREWRFTKKAIPVMELAPWGTTESKVLHMERL
jgi:major membrane immunogen (membrane-anchored lipoprotein)